MTDEEIEDFRKFTSGKWTTADAAIARAKTEIAAEQFYALVEAEKERLRHHRPWWQKVFPFTITITRR
jgi:hypothetical protein